VNADPAVQTALATLAERLHSRHTALDAAAKKTIVPVRHTLIIGPLP
jgi:hypothetical protein